MTRLWIFCAVAALAAASGSRVWAQQQIDQAIGPAAGDESLLPPPRSSELNDDELLSPPPPPPEGWGAKDARGRHLRWDQAQSQPSAQELREVLELLKEQDPQLAERLEAMRLSDPQRAQQMLRPHVPGLMRLAYLKRTDPEHFRLRMQDIKLDRQCRELAQQIRTLSQNKVTTDAQVQPLRQELAEVLAQQFEVRQQLQEKMVADLEQRLEKLRQEVQQRKGQKDQLVNQRLQELLQQDEGPKW